MLYPCWCEKCFISFLLSIIVFKNHTISTQININIQKSSKEGLTLVTCKIEFLQTEDKNGNKPRIWTFFVFICIYMIENMIREMKGDLSILPCIVLNFHALNVVMIFWFFCHPIFLIFFLSFSLPNTKGLLVLFTHKEGRCGLFINLELIQKGCASFFLSFNYFQLKSEQV